VSRPTKCSRASRFQCTGAPAARRRADRSGGANLEAAQTAFTRCTSHIPPRGTGAHAALISAQDFDAAKATYNAAAAAFAVAQRSVAVARSSLVVAQRDEDDTVVRAPSPESSP